MIVTWLISNSKGGSLQVITSCIISFSWMVSVMFVGESLPACKECAAQRTGCGRNQFVIGLMPRFQDGRIISGN